MRSLILIACLFATPVLAGDCVGGSCRRPVAAAVAMAHEGERSVLKRRPLRRVLMAPVKVLQRLAHRCHGE